jgi:hypothetical protein
MAFVGVGDSSASGFESKAGHVYVNIYERLKVAQDPALHIKTNHPHYLVHRFLELHNVSYGRCLDHSCLVPAEYGELFLDAARLIQEELLNVEEAAKLLDKTVSEDVDVADADSFHKLMEECHGLIDRLEPLKLEIAGINLIIETAAQSRGGEIPGLATLKAVTTRAFSPTIARNYPDAYEQCLKEKVTGSLSLHYKGPELPTPEVDFERDYTDEELSSVHRQYWNLTTEMKLIQDLLDVEKKHLKVAIGKSNSSTQLFVWYRRVSKEVDAPKMRELYPDIYEACKVEQTSFKCTIKPWKP